MKSAMMKALFSGDIDTGGILMAEQEKCVYCGSTRKVEEGHLIAKSKGGKATIPACQKCNRSKGSKAFMDWLRWLKENDKYRWDRVEDFHKGKRNDMSKKVQKVRDE